MMPTYSEFQVDCQRLRPKQASSNHRRILSMIPYIWEAASNVSHIVAYRRRVAEGHEMICLGNSGQAMFHRLPQIRGLSQSLGSISSISIEQK